MKTIHPDLMQAIEDATHHFLHNRYMPPPYYLYTPHDLERTWIKTAAGRVMVKIDPALPLGTIYVLSERVS